MNLKHGTLFIAILFLISCAAPVNNKLIVGKWTGISWVVDGKPSAHNTAATHFIFDDKGNYTFTYEATEQKGTYKVENDMLFTKPANQEEIMVKINRLTADSLVFDMNRGGTNEVLSLLKDK